MPGSPASYRSTAAMAASRRGGEERRVVDERPQRSRRRVLVGHPDEQQLLEAGRGRAGVDVRELRADVVEEAASLGRPERRRDGVGRPVHAALRHELRGTRHDHVEDLVEQLERRQLAGLGARLARCAASR